MFSLVFRLEVIWCINKIHDWSFLNNSYPSFLIKKIISIYLNNMINKTSDNTSNNIDYIKFPFYGHLSYRVCNNLSKLLKLHYSGTTFKYIFSNSFTVGSFFQNKDSLPKTLMLNVIGNYTYSWCKSRYIGEMHGNLIMRVAEHTGVSARTGYPSAFPSK